MVKLIVGLGNPGLQYEKTRHNVGFLFLDGLSGCFGCSWSESSRFEGLVSDCLVFGEKLLFLKPYTYMNKSGQSVGKVARYYKIKCDEILVVHDELDFDVGVSKFKFGGGHAGHNGLRDISAHLNDNDFYRLRIGIGRPVADKSVAEYVLSEPSQKEWGDLKFVFERSKEAIPKIILNGMPAVMNKFNMK